MVQECPRCGSANAVTIAIELPGGARVSLVSCHTCDTRTWRTTEREVSLAEVLEMAASAESPRAPDTSD